ncbi:hypothetical protein I9018_13435 [Pseudomonas sp. MPFS]|uniref:AAA domain-containing protein n=1 Tax=Pseudomonas sp. MPFS TaxID=2795724 RepID=UPI001F141B79|nr:AAA domain-containing protein [Pseudomonas sp. MPFS]UMZ14629.1 hypothetical protein I9018_13435 [Pseudomonas sp. MPFS]
MNEHALKLATYWRNSLADAENGNGALDASQAEKLIEVPNCNVSSGRLPVELAEMLFMGEPQTAATIKVTLRPLVYYQRLEHGKARKDMPAVVTPLVCDVLVTRDGRLYPTSRVLLPRDILEPLDQDNFTIGTQADLDAFLSTKEVPCFEPSAAEQTQDEEEHHAQWRTYLHFCWKMLRTVSNGWKHNQDSLMHANHGLLFKEDKPSGFSQNIVRLYDYLRHQKPKAQLFERFAQHTPSLTEPCLAPHSGFAVRLAHAGDEYALASAQRDALTHLLVGEAGDVLAVNGPPGTGKTTLVLSVVASLWARAALAGGDPPVIVASSTNNQAVTNIIAAFGKDFAHGCGPLAGRWLPEIKSFGAYFPKASAEKDMSNAYQTQAFLTGLESPAYLEQAQAQYLTKAIEAFPDAQEPGVRDVVERLREQIQVRHQQLLGIEQAWPALVAAREAVMMELGPTPQATIAQRELSCDEQRQQLCAAQQRLKNFRHYLAHESLFYTLFNWIGPVAAKRLRLAKLQLAETDPLLQGATSIAEIENYLTSAEAVALATLAERETRLRLGQQLLATEQRELATWRVKIAVLAQASEKPAAQVTLAECDAWADTSVRFEIFLLTTHYWEGRWLMELAEDLPAILKRRGKNGAKTIAGNWRRWMKLTPCVVATFFRLPAELLCKRHENGDFVDDYLVDFIDLLIVDEAGQVLPEVAAPSFALARQALVIGDTQQIEPIWSIPASVDIGNLASAGLVDRSQVKQGYAAFCNGGHSAASGSVMAVAQSASRYHYDPELARGMYLYEHRRCYDSIIAFCNALCYKGKLQPRRGQKPAGGLPGLGYLHIDGLCRQNNQGSRENLLEAQTIAAWIQANEAQLRQRYGNKELCEIVGVITPFSAQAATIAQACAALGIRAGKGASEITVGTVHSFQGAERPVVIFSAVYSKHDDGGFIDRRESMLNVAVSRAKDSFLVFGDMDLFSQVPPGKPRGLLAQFLLANPTNELQFAYQPREDLGTGLSHLHEWVEHDAFLAQTLRTARQQVQIVTPWVRLRCLHSTGALAHMRDTVQRGVQVEVYTDLLLNTEPTPSNPGGDPKKVQQFQSVLAELKAQAIQVRVVKKVHSKLLMADQELLCVGSFNWLSAQREGDFVRHETSMVYRGKAVRDEIEVNRNSLAKRVTPYT